MSSTQAATSTTTRKQRLARLGKKPGLGTASTPNLNSLYSSHSRIVPPLPGALGRKASFAAFNSTSLSIPDDYANRVLNETSTSSRSMAPLTPAKGARAGDDFAPGDVVDVPGNLSGTVRFVGSVAGRKGTFAGVELHPDFAGRGKNNGDVDGISYFTTHTPGAGIFVPVAKLFKRDSPPTSAASSFPLTPSGNSASALKVASQNTINFNSTPSITKFSQSVGPGRAPSPSGRKSRTSLPRPDSPVRRLQLPPIPRTTTPASKVAPRYGTPSPANKFAQSARGTAGDPLKPVSRKPSFALRSASALGGPSAQYSEDETTPVGRRPQANGSVGSMSSLKMRPASRAAQVNEEEIERLKAHLEDRDRQLKDQAAALAEMESSVTELTSLMEHTDLGGRRPDSMGDKDTSQLRALLREKNEKIAMLTAEFDAHRADFRSTIDTLELASTETQRVYDARIQELEQEIHNFQDRADDVDSVARQLKQLEELVQELEEGLEDARRGEAEARGEVEFLRGEVERTRTELRREREKASAALNGGANGDVSSLSKELEKKEDEIRGLKAIIHSLSRDSLPSGESPDKTPTQPQRNQWSKNRPETVEERIAREKLEHEVRELRALVNNKNSREEELEHEVETLRRGSATTHRGSSLTIGSNNRSSYRDSKGTIIPAHEPRLPEHKRVATLDTMAESDAYSSVTESSTLWCEICETGGHDILTCTNMGFSAGSPHNQKKSSPVSTRSSKDAAREDVKALKVPDMGKDNISRPLTPVKSVAPPAASNVKILPNPTDSGPLAGKDSGVVDLEKWCALCERDGHDSIDCPLEDAF